MAFVTDAEPEDPEKARPLVTQTLCRYVCQLEADKRAAAMATIVPTLVTRATVEGEEVYEEVSSRLLEVAAADQGAFRAVVAGMSGGQRALLEEVIRSKGRGSQATDKRSPEGASQPSITLKMTFGG